MQARPIGLVLRVVSDMSDVLVYAVRNHEGKWFHAVGYGGYGKSWVDEFSKAKLYAKLGTARGRVTFWKAHRSDLPVPEIHAFRLEPAGQVSGEDARVKKSHLSKAKKNLSRLKDSQKRHGTSWVSDARIKVAEDEVKRLAAEVKK